MDRLGGEHLRKPAVLMIYYTNIRTIAPDNSYLVFNAEGSILGKLSAHSYRICATGTLFCSVVQPTESPTSGTSERDERPHQPSFLSGEAPPRNLAALLDLIGHCIVSLTEHDPHC